MNCERRRDWKHRLLRDGEGQKKDGSYYFRYKDTDGVIRAVYSWRLVETDITPAGKRDKAPLRELEEEVRRKLAKHESIQKGKCTVLELVEKYVSQKAGVKHTTKLGYQTVLKFLRNDPFGMRSIGDIKTSDTRIWLVKLQQEDKKGYSAIHNIRGVVRPAFQMAVDDDILVKNPFDFELATVLVNDSVTREAISRRDERRFLEFVKNDRTYRKYYDGMLILLNTGLRISEFTGLTISDIDLNERTVNVDKQLQRTMTPNGLLTYIDTTKTYAGKRIIPMSDEVYEAFVRIIDNRKEPKEEPVIDGYSGFLFLDKDRKPMVAQHWEKHFQLAVQKHNRIYKEELPKITPHVCRHTYCSNMAKSGMNPKVLQYLMGHSDIGVTLNTYTHVRFDDAQAELSRLSKAQEEQEMERMKAANPVLEKSENRYA